MKKRLFKRLVDQERADIRQRLDAHRISRKPACHIVLPDEDLKTLAPEFVQAYEITHGLKLVPLSARAEHVATVCVDGIKTESAA